MSLQGSHHGGASLEAAYLIASSFDLHFLPWLRLGLPPLFLAAYLDGSMGLHCAFLFNLQSRSPLRSEGGNLGLAGAFYHVRNAAPLSIGQAIFPDSSHLFLGRGLHFVGPPVDHELADLLRGGFGPKAGFVFFAEAFLSRSLPVFDKPLDPLLAGCLAEYLFVTSFELFLLEVPLAHDSFDTFGHVQQSKSHMVSLGAVSQVLALLFEFPVEPVPDPLCALLSHELRLKGEPLARILIPSDIGENEMSMELRVEEAARVVLEDSCD